MSLKLSVSLAAIGMSLLAAHAYADGEGGEGNWEPPAYHAATRAAPGGAVAVDAAPRPASPATQHTGIGSSGPILAQPSSFGAVRPSAWPYEESDVAATDLGRRRSELAASKPVTRTPVTRTPEKPPR